MNATHNDNQGSDSDSEYDFVATESDNTSNSEHISEESHLSNSDIEQGDVITASQPETLQKDGITRSMYPNLEQSRITILNAFKLFFTNEILDEIVLHTILYAKRYFDQKIRSRQDSNTIRLDSHFWKLIDHIELESFIGLLIQSSVNRSNHELLYDLWDISQSCPLYRATVYPIRYIFELFVKQLPKHLVPGENLTFDEQLVPFRGRCCFVQYMPNKPTKYGLKFWILSDVDSR
ncbi:unnamed protein product, partial [Rotaria sordida]